jgi:hypothetical protein
MCIGLHVNYPLFLSDFKEIQLSGQIFEKYSNTKFYENLSSGSRVVPCGRTDRQTDTTMLRVAFINFENAPEDACEPPLSDWGSVTAFCEHDDEHPV